MASAGGEAAPSPAGDPAAVPNADASATPRLRVARIADIERLPEGQRWLVEGFLTNGSIAVLGSTPKAGKTWVALALSVGIASGTPALGRFHVPSPGPVLLFHAEDDSRAVRERIEAIATGQGLAFDALPIHVITEASLQLDDEENRKSLEGLIDELRPKLLVLDPLVRLHQASENSSTQMAKLFSYLRTLQRRFGVAILLTHHVAKNRSAGAGQPGSSLRGSGDIHAAYDHGAALQRRPDGSVLLTIEHRSAPSPDPIAFRIVSQVGGATTFEVVEIEGAEGEPAVPAVARGKPNAAAVAIDVQVLRLLQSTGEPLSQVTIRKSLKVRNATLTNVLRKLEARGAIENLGRQQGWRAVSPPREQNF